MKRKVIKKLTTTERLTLLEQIFAPQGGDTQVQFASCALSNMAFLFDFEDANMIEMTWSSEDGNVQELIEKANYLISPDREQKLRLGMPYMIHVILPQEPITLQSVISWLKHDEPIAIEHFVNTTINSNNITLRIMFIENEIGNKIADEAFKNNRFLHEK